MFTVHEFYRFASQIFAMEPPANRFLAHQNLKRNHEDSKFQFEIFFSQFLCKGWQSHKDHENSHKNPVRPFICLSTRCSFVRPSDRCTSVYPSGRKVVEPALTWRRKKICMQEKSEKKLKEEERGRKRKWVERTKSTARAHGHDGAHGNRIIQKIFHWVLWEA